MKRYLQNILYALPAVSGAAALPAALLFRRSDAENAWFLGISRLRWAIAGAVLIFWLAAILVFLNRRIRKSWLWYPAGLIGLLSAEILLFSRFPSDNTQNLLPMLGERTLPLLLLMLLSGLCWLWALTISEDKAPSLYGFFLVTAAVLIYWPLSAYTDRYAWQIDLHGNTWMCLALIGSALLWLLTFLVESGRSWKTAMGVLFFIVLGFCVVWSTGLWMGRADTPPNAYWNELAGSFLEGRLDLPEPSGTHDLTLYEGKWYVPNPPLPGILLIPVVRAKGSSAAVNTCIYSAILSGLCCGFFFLMLILAFTRQEGPLHMAASDHTVYPGRSLSVSVWVTVLFTFGSDLLWLGTTGQMWFISQLTAVLFTLLACICVISGCSAVTAGCCLGLAVLSRPNVFPVFFCLLGIRLHHGHDFPRFEWKKTLGWCLKCGIPVLISAGLLLVYNKLRFNSWTDFGYVTINGADWILENVREYGMFHPHFLKTNADVMLFGVPQLDLSGARFFFQPHLAGYSIFLMTPPLIFIFRAIHRNWYAVGTWTAVILSVALLLLYHNTGAEQIGYRYILDIAAPLALLTADGMRGKVNRLFKVLTIFAVLISFAGTGWWYLGR